MLRCSGSMYSEGLENKGATPRVSYFAANGLYLLAVAGLMAASFYSVPLAHKLVSIFPNMDVSTLEMLISAAYYLPMLLIPSAWVLRRTDAIKYARLQPIGFGQMIAVAGIAVLGFFAVSYINVLWLLLLELLNVPIQNSAMTLPYTRAGLVAAVFSMGVMPGVCEELLFRGVILSAYERKGTKKAIIISAVFFTTVHGSISGIPAQLILGLVMGFIVFAYDSIYASIVYHTVHNSVILVFSLIAARESVAEQAVDIGTFASIGGWSGVISAALTAAFFCWMLVLCLRSVNRRRLRRGIQGVAPTGEKMSRGARWILVITVLIALAVYVLTILGAAML